MSTTILLLRMLFSFIKDSFSGTPCILYYTPTITPKIDVKTIHKITDFSLNMKRIRGKLTGKLPALSEGSDSNLEQI